MLFFLHVEEKTFYCKMDHFLHLHHLTETITMHSRSFIFPTYITLSSVTIVHSI
jgi:hypothetical protein